MEKEQYMKVQDTRLSVFKVICLAVKHHGHTNVAQTKLTNMLQFHEHVAEHVAECLSMLAKEYDHSQLIDELLRDISGMNFGGQDTKGPRYFSRFLTRLSELSPRSLIKQFPLLISQLDSEVRTSRLCLTYAD
jgi:condensin complex subunit 1